MVNSSDRSLLLVDGYNQQVSINSTSEEVRSRINFLQECMGLSEFPLIQLPRKSEVFFSIVSL